MVGVTYSNCLVDRSAAAKTAGAAGASGGSRVAGVRGAAWETAGRTTRRGKGVRAVPCIHSLYISQGSQASSITGERTGEALQ